MVSALIFATSASLAASPEPLLVKSAVTSRTDFAIVQNSQPAEILFDQTDAAVVQTSAQMLAGDIEAVTGLRPTINRSITLSGHNAPVIIIGTLGHSALIDDLVSQRKIDPSSIDGKWESYIVATLQDVGPGVPHALVVVGSDRRGTAYGVLDISKAIGVSPWVWWADVVPAHRDTLVLAGGTHAQGPPSVKYRGIFLNDEDWGLRPWAAKTLEPETGNIGPKTYAKVCELLLRLRANYLWPAMHPGTKAFNLIRENPLVADRYGIVMGSSHAEPMLRNNVGEWPADKGKLWNPVTNLPAIVQYWEQRVRENASYENIYTMGMRGVHDSGMPGGGSVIEKRDRLENIIGLQRALLAKYVNPNPALVPQIFCPYKEVLEIYQAGMHLPDDITILWPDDNHGYIRQLPTPKERERGGGHGIYYHLSYWGRPHDYLWLDSTSPALIWHEMTKAYALGAQRLWVANVGDLKSIETGMTFFLELAWNIDRYGPDVQRAFLRDFYIQQFGAEHADEIASLRDEYYRLSAIRRPEHLGFNRVYPNTPVQNSGWSAEQFSELLQRWREVAQHAEVVGAKLPPRLHDAYFELVQYPVCGAASMAEKLLLAEQARQTGSPVLADQAEAAFLRIQRLTTEYNAAAHGKWRDVMDYKPRNLPVFDMPPTQPGSIPPAVPSSQFSPLAIRLDPASYTQRQDQDDRGWRVIQGLGPHGHALAILPQRDTPTQHSPRDIAAHCPFAEYAIAGGKGGVVKVTIEALPTHQLTPAHDDIVAVSIEKGAPVAVHFDEGEDDENDPTWQRNVLRSAMLGTIHIPVPAGPYHLRLWAADPAIVVSRITIDPSSEAAP